MVKQEAELKHGTSHLFYKIAFPNSSVSEAKSFSLWIRRNLVTQWEQSVNLPITCSESSDYIFFPTIVLLQGFLTSSSESSALSPEPWRNRNRLSAALQHQYARLGPLFSKLELPWLSWLHQLNGALALEKTQQLLTSLSLGPWTSRVYYFIFQKYLAWISFYNYHPSSPWTVLS